MANLAEVANDVRDALLRGRLAVLVGTGVTAAATNQAPTSSWGGLIENGISRCEASGSRDKAWADRARADVHSEYDLDLIVAAEKATDGLGGRDSVKFRQWLAQAVGTLRAVDTALLEAITGLADEGALIVTTNYDDLLSTALGWEVVTWRDPIRLQRVLRGDEQAVVHLHGHWKEPASIVFGASSYADVLRDPGAATFLKTTVYSSTLLFVGFGAGLDDPNFSGLRRWMRSELSLSDYQHYRLVRDTDVGTVQHDPAERIEVAAYGPNFSDLAPFLTTLRSGITTRGTRSLDLTLESNAHAGTSELVPGTVPLPTRKPSAEQIRELLERSAHFAELMNLADMDDEDHASEVAGGGDRLDAIKRFVALFAEELAQVVEAATQHAQLDADAAELALTWARRLTEINHSE